MNRKKFFMVLCLLGGFCVAKAEPQDTTTLVLSLDSAKQVAMEHNRTLKNASLDVQKAEATRWQSIAGMLPQVQAGATYTDMVNYSTEWYGVSIPYPPYGMFNITASMAISGAQVVSAYLGTIAKDMADITLKQTEQQIGDQVKSIYYSILVMEQTLDLLQLNLANIEKLYETTQKSVDVGAAEQVDADQLAVQVATMQTTINSSERSLEVLYNSMRLQLGLQPDQPIALSQSLDELINFESALELLGEEFNIENNYNYQLVKENTRQAKQQVNLSAWSYGPTLSATYQYSAKKYFTDQQGMLDMTPPNTVQVSVSLPIFSSGKNFSTVKAAKLDYQKALNTQADTEASLQTQYSEARFNLSSTFETFETQKKNVEVTQRVLNNISAKYEHGYASSLEVTNAATNLITAQNSYIQAILELVKAQITLEELLNKQ